MRLALDLRRRGLRVELDAAGEGDFAAHVAARGAARAVACGGSAVTLTSAGQVHTLSHEQLAREAVAW
jgi:hypothetical protein